MFKQRWFYLGCCLLIALFTVVGAYAQTKTIKGKVVDEKSQPMIGVSVVIKGTKTGTITDEEGSYSISASPKDVLSFSFIGYKASEEKIGSRTTVNVALNEDSQMLQEAVITAEFGVKRAARSVGAAIQNVKGSDIAESGRENFIDALQGRVAGVNVTSSSGSPGASSTVVFRAPTSISGKNSPLYVIDGIPMSNTTFDATTQAASTTLSATQNDYTNRGSDIDADNIESMTVLKGAAAAALYGSDASNGAIIITTKKGRSGKAKISYNTDIRFDQVYRYPKEQTTYDQGTYGTTNYYSSVRWGAPYAAGTKLYDNVKELLKTGVSQKHNVALEAGNETMTLRASAGLLDQTGVIPVASYKRKNLALSGSMKANNWLSFDGSLQYVNSENHKVAKGVGGVLDLALKWPSTDNMKNYLAADGSSIKYPDKYGDTDILNPYYDLYKDKRYDTSDRFISALNMIITPLKDLQVRAQFGWDVSASTYITCINPQFTTSTTKAGSYDQSNVAESDPTLNLLASYKKSIKKFDFNAQVGYHQLEVGSKTLAVYGSNFYVQDLQSINNCAQSTITNTQITKKRRVQAVSGSLEMSYNNMAFLTLRGRNDWSSTLPVDNQSYFYPAADVSFMLSELPFLKKHSETWSYLKLRGSAAQVGKDADPLSIKPALQLQTTTGAGYAYGYTGPNNQLKPEMNTAWEVGVEGRMFDNRLNFDVSYYDTHSKDQIISGFRMSYATGFVLNTRNMGSFKTNGTEFLVSYDFIRNHDWSLNVGVNGSRNWSKVLSLPNGVTEYYNAYTWVSGNIRNGIMVGSPITTITGLDYQRNKKGQILIDPTSGLPLISSTWSVLGDREPKLSYGFTALVKHKNFSLSCLFNGKLGATIVNGTKRLMMTYGTSTESVTLRNRGAVVFNGVLKDGKQDSSTPTVSNIAVKLADLNGYTGSDIEWIEKGVNYLTLSEVRLSYNLDAKLIAKLTKNLVSKCSVFVAGSDMFLWTNYSGIDPTGNANSAALGGTGGVGYDMLSIGTPRGYSFGFNITF
ncbi:MAG: SusC/RagA family TonB-linked outer membrane protein [Bacteroidetes bacterium]|nr:SusC/RagA family TonB-linked outer membrane protein [Bacteroidota bacterium]